MTQIQPWTIAYRLNVLANLDEQSEQFNIRTIETKGDTFPLRINGLRLQDELEKKLTDFLTYSQSEEFDTTRDSIFTNGQQPTITRVTEPYWVIIQKNGQRYIPKIKNSNTLFTHLPISLVQNPVSIDSIALIQELAITEHIDPLEKDHNLNRCTDVVTRCDYFRPDSAPFEKGSFIFKPFPSAQSYLLPLTPGIEELFKNERFLVNGKSLQTEILATQEHPISIQSPEGRKYLFID